MNALLVLMILRDYYFSILKDIKKRIINLEFKIKMNFIILLYNEVTFSNSLNQAF